MEFSDKVHEIHTSAFKIFLFRDANQGVKELETYLQETNDLDEAERVSLDQTLHTWRQAADPTFLPAPNASEEDAFPLVFRSHIAGRAGDHRKAVSDLWLFVRHCPIGTASFLDALQFLAGAAHHGGYADLARHSVEMWLSHYDLMMDMAEYATEATRIAIVGFVSDPNLLTEQILIPWSVALDYIGKDPAPCWARILMLEARTATPEDRNQPYYKHVVAAIHQHVQSERE